MRQQGISKYLLSILGIAVVSLFLSSFTLNKTNEDLIPLLRESLNEKGCNTDSIRIHYVAECAVNARVLNGQIEICNRFFKYKFRDQVSILWHEVFHLNNDKEWIQTSIILNQVEYIQDVPSDIADYINNVMNSDLEFDYSKRIAYKRVIGLYEVRDTVYYQNEINAYRNEINIMTDVSTGYDAERKFMLWKHTESLRIARKYYLSQT